jgi:hypothetical protein
MGVTQAFIMEAPNKKLREAPTGPHVVYQGVPGCFSAIAAHEYFKVSQDV